MKLKKSGDPVLRFFCVHITRLVPIVRRFSKRDPMPLTPQQIEALRALLDRLIPEDEFPGALAAGTDKFILQLLTHACAAETPIIAQSLTQLDAEAIARHDLPFSKLPIAAQDALIYELEHNRTATAWPTTFPATGFINRLIDLAAEGFYADPANGGNRDASSWRMIGYNPLLPVHPTAP